jgi:hypothetical protein
MTDSPEVWGRKHGLKNIPVDDGDADWDQGRDEQRRGKADGAPLPYCFKLVRFRDLKLDTSGNYVIKGLIPREGLVVIWGPPKCGKSFKTMDMFLHVALDWQYRGRRVKQGIVVYCALEGQSGFPARKEAFCVSHGKNAANAQLYLMFTPLDLINNHTTLIHDIEAELTRECPNDPHAVPVAIVIDTLNRTLVGSESDDRDMAAYVKAADALRDRFKCVVVIVHHCGIDGSRPRGHTSLTGAVDGQIAVKRDEAKNIIATVEHSKDGIEGEVITSKLDIVEVGRDDDGDPITSCVVVPVEVVPEAEPEAAPEPRPGKRQKPNDRQLNALIALRQVITSDGIEPPDNVSSRGTRVVTLDQWKAKLVSIDMLNIANRRMEKRFEEIRDPLLARGLIGIQAPFVWAEISMSL